MRQAVGLAAGRTRRGKQQAARQVHLHGLLARRVRRRRAAAAPAASAAVHGQHEAAAVEGRIAAGAQGARPRQQCARSVDAY